MTLTDMLTDTEYERWQNVWRSLHATPPADLLDLLGQRYSEPHRAYHTLDHVRTCLAQVDAVRALLQQPALVELAIWFHDAIYDPRAADNEAQSAQWAHDALRAGGAGEDATQRVASLIRLTRHDVAPDSADNDARLLLDIDLAILGAEPAAFDAYEAQIRCEYHWVPWAEFCHKRALVLRSFVQRPAIYSTDHFQQRLEQRARLNIRRSLAQLSCTA